jgi:4-hydroxy-tetrahydrodipicolinate synthase
MPASIASVGTVAAAGQACKGVFGGQGGIYLLDEYRRGAAGNMPASQATDVHVAIWDKLEAGDQARARALFNRLLPLINYERLYGVAVYKQVLHRRGVFATTVSRAPGQHLDDDDRAELDAILADVEALFTA